MLVCEERVVGKPEHTKERGVELGLEAADRAVTAVRAPIRPVERRRPVEKILSAAIAPEPAREEPVDPRELERRPVRHRCVDHLAPARRPRVEDAGADAEGEHHPAATHVADQVERHDRIPVGRPDRSERPGESDVVDVVARLPGERAVLPPPRHAAVDEPRVAREARVRPEPEPLCDARSKPLDERVRPIDEPERQIRRLPGS